MRKLAESVVQELNLDYTVTMVSGGERGNCEIVMWDRPRNSYFSVRLTPGSRDLAASAALIRQELQQRNVAHQLADDRRPVRRSTAA